MPGLSIFKLVQEPQKQSDIAEFFRSTQQARTTWWQTSIRFSVDSWELRNSGWSYSATELHQDRLLRWILVCTRWAGRVVWTTSTDCWTRLKGFAASLPLRKRLQPRSRIARMTTSQGESPLNLRVSQFGFFLRILEEFERPSTPPHNNLRGKSEPLNKSKTVAKKLRFVHHQATAARFANWAKWFQLHHRNVEKKNRQQSK